MRKMFVLKLHVQDWKKMCTFIDCVTEKVMLHLYHDIFDVKSCNGEWNENVQFSCMFYEFHTFQEETYK